jgi:hypothetical protein
MITECSTAYRYLESMKSISDLCQASDAKNRKFSNIFLLACAFFTNIYPNCQIKF